MCTWAMRSGEVQVSWMYAACRARNYPHRYDVIYVLPLDGHPRLLMVPEQKEAHHTRHSRLQALQHVVVGEVEGARVRQTSVQQARARIPRQPGICCSCQLCNSCWWVLAEQQRKASPTHLDCLCCIAVTAASMV